MTFGEKLLKLRKEKGLSQEALAEQLNTSRQAVSKWENNQGYPETEKLILISNLFNISIDSLLKENGQAWEKEGEGYYVSRECAEGYLLQEKKLAKRVAAGVGLLIGGVVPFVSLGLDDFFAIAVICVLLIISIGILATTMFMDNQYQQLEKERLLMDHLFYAELKSRYEVTKKKLFVVALFGIAMLVIGGVIFKNISVSTYMIKELCCVFFTVGLYNLCYTLGILNSYEILLDSDERYNRLHIQIWRKVKDKLTK